MSVLEEQAAHHSSSVTFNISLAPTDRLSRNGNLLNLWNSPPPPADAFSPESAVWSRLRLTVCEELWNLLHAHSDTGLPSRGGSHPAAVVLVNWCGFVALRCLSEGRKYDVGLKMCKFAKMVSRSDFSFPLAGSNQVKVKWRYEKRRKLQRHTRQRKCLLLRTVGAVHCVTVF